MHSSTHPFVHPSVHQPTPRQLTLPGLNASAPPFSPDVVHSSRGAPTHYTLLLAIFPPIDDALRFHRVASRWGSRHGLGGAPLAAERLHVTLHAIAIFGSTLASAVVDAALVAAAGVDCPPLPITFDRAMSFVNTKSNRATQPFVLRCNARSDAAIARLRQPLASALRRVGLRPCPSRTPHMTLLYDRQRVAEHAIEPLCWTAARFALVVSHVGIGHHQWLGQWNLRGPGPGPGLPESAAAAAQSTAGSSPNGFDAARTFTEVRC